MNVLWIDVETTGLDKNRNGIIQIAGLIEIDGEIKERFNLQMNPEAEFDPASEAIHGISEREVAGFPSKEETFRRFKEILDRYVRPEQPESRLRPAGYNVRFDLGFLEQWFRAMERESLGSYLRRERIDPSNLMKAFQEYFGKERMPSWSLRAVASLIGLPFGRRHDALEDIELTREIHLRLLSLFGPGVSSDGS